MKRKIPSILTKWFAGFGISLLAIWGITAVFTENIYPEIWAEELERNVPGPGWSFDYRTESWARSEFGELGLAGIADVSREPLPKILFWGDSFVQGAQVSDDRKLHSQLTGMPADDGRDPFTAISIGHYWWSVADYYFHIPAYERAIDGCRLHVIHLFTLEDIYPDRYPGARVSLFLSEPKLHFEKYDNEYREIETPATIDRYRSVAYRSRLQFFLRMKKRAQEISRLEGLRFALGNHSADPGRSSLDSIEWTELKQPEWVSEDAPTAAWQFVLNSLKNVTDLPFLFVYAPVTPTLDEGKVIEENPEKLLAIEFAELCRENGFGFVSLEDSFHKYWKQTGKLPRGFPSSRPGEGHYNADGHRLVAEIVHDWIRKNPDVVHPD